MTVRALKAGTVKSSHKTNPGHETKWPPTAHAEDVSGVRRVASKNRATTRSCSPSALADHNQRLSKLTKVGLADSRLARYGLGRWIGQCSRVAGRRPTRGRRWRNLHSAWSGS